MILKNQQNMLPTWTKTIYMVMPCQNLFQWVDLSGCILQNLTEINMIITVQKVVFYPTG